MTTELKIEGMSCEHCVAAVKKALEGVQGVRAAAVSLQEESARVEHDGADPEKMVAAVEEEGYHARLA